MASSNELLATLNRLSQEAESEMLKSIEGDLHPRTQISDEITTLDHTGLVTLDVAIHALHLVTARVALRTIPGIFRQKVAAMKRTIAEFLVSWASAKVAFKLGGLVLAKTFAKALGKLVLIGEVWEADQIQIGIETGIRRASIRTMRDVPKMKKKPRAGSKRKRSRVASRHP